MAGGFVFVGASALGWDCCHALLEARVPCDGIITMPQDFRISWSTAVVTNVNHRRFDDLATKADLPLLQMDGRWDDTATAWLCTCAPRLLIVVGWYHMIPRRIRDLAVLGAVGIHASMLPKYRGGAPLVWAIINGETETGTTLFKFTDGVDDGDIVAQERLTIGDADDINHLQARAAIESVRLTVDTVPRILAGQATFRPQDHAQATVVPQRSPSDGGIPWTRSAAQVRNWVRAQTRPYPGAFTDHGATRLRVWRVALDGTRDLLPGEWLKNSDDGIVVGCGDGAVILEDVTVEQIGQRSVGGPAAFAVLQDLLAGSDPLRFSEPISALPT